MNVLSLFDGISCGRVALERAGIQVDNYYASEIDKYAIQVSKNNYPDIIRMGDINNWQEWNIDWSSIDLILAGSPCQSFSIAGKQLAFNDPRGQLFFVFVNILNQVKKFNPSVKFLLENVRMKKEYIQVINECLGVEPTLINSALVSAQNRQRLYWANWEITQPEDKGILLKDIVHEKETDFKKIDTFNINPSGKGINGNVYSVHNNKSPTLTTNKGEGIKISVPIITTDKDKSNCITASIGRTTDCEYFYKSQQQLLYCLIPYVVPFDKTLKILEAEKIKGKIGYFKADSQANRVYSIHGKSVTLCGEAGGGAAKMGQYLFGCLTPDRIEKRQNGQRFNDGEKFYTLTAQDKHGVLLDGYIRKLTPIECERLQTLPDNFSQGISNSQRYKCLGNSWTVDVIAHILKSINGTKYTPTQNTLFIQEARVW